jgi:hypothetical protein
VAGPGIRFRGQPFVFKLEVAICDFKFKAVSYHMVYHAFEKAKNGKVLPFLHFIFTEINCDGQKRAAIIRCRKKDIKQDLRDQRAKGND